MQLAIRELVPAYFDEEAKTHSGIWGKELVFEQGELIKIVAPSGRGKSSLINFLYGSRSDYRGTIIYSNRDLREFSITELASHRAAKISIVFQDLKLFTSQTVLQNIEIKRQLSPFHPAEKIRDMADRLGIGDKLDSTVATCSYGEQQRVAIIRSLMQPFDLLLLDEPFSHLDNENTNKALQLLLEEARHRHATVIFADLERLESFPYTQLYHL